MLLVERHIISPKHKHYKEVDTLTFKSKNLYNAGLYAIRQHFFSTGQYLPYKDLQKQFQNENQPDYRALPAKVSQHILKQLDVVFTSFFKALKKYNQDSSKFLGKPKIPKYKDKAQGRNLLTYTEQAISSTMLKRGYVKLSNTNITFHTKQKNIQQVRISPQATCYVIEVVYEADDVPIKKKPTILAGIDIGLNNLCAVASNKVGFKPFLINGRPLKSINQYYNKQIAFLKAQLATNQKTSKRIEKITLKRNCKIKDYLHKASRKLVDALEALGIEKIVVGKNNNWKQEINIGNKNNQNFVCVPHAEFIEQITYKANRLGICVQVTEESYTSKCSFLDNEPIEKREVYAGKRVKRGLFKTATGRRINADVNASYNIIRKVAPNTFSEGVEGVVVHPYRYKNL